MSTPYYIEPGFWDPETGRKVAILINDAQGVNDNPTISYPSASGTVALTTDLPNTLTLVASGNASFTGAATVSIPYLLYSFGISVFMAIGPASFTSVGGDKLTSSAFIGASYRPTGSFYEEQAGCMNNGLATFKINTDGKVDISQNYNSNISAGATTLEGTFLQWTTL